MKKEKEEEEDKRGSASYQITENYLLKLMFVTHWSMERWWFHEGRVWWFRDEKGCLTLKPLKCEASDFVKDGYELNESIYSKSQTKAIMDSNMFASITSRALNARARFEFVHEHHILLEFVFDVRKARLVSTISISNSNRTGSVRLPPLVIFVVFRYLDKYLSLTLCLLNSN